jgi:hypothetical protein
VSSGGPIWPTRSVLSALPSSPGAHRPTNNRNETNVRLTRRIARSVVRPTPRASSSRRSASKPSSPTPYVNTPERDLRFRIFIDVAANRRWYRLFASA